MDLPEEPEVQKSKSTEHTSTAPAIVVEPEEEEEKACHVCHDEQKKQVTLPLIQKLTF
jgi:hypothetical protein